MNTKIAAIILLAGASSLAACKTTAPDDLPPEGGTYVPPDTNGSQSNQPGVGTQEHFLRGVQGQNVIFFDTDRYNIDSQDAAILQTQASYLGQNPSVTVTIEGHADERGTRDYNLALGERRANAAKNYLVSLGIAANRITTVSYGEERPIATASTPEAWAQNRRAVTMVIN